MSFYSVLVSGLGAILTKVAPNSTYGFSSTPVQEVTNPPYLTHPDPIILPGSSEPVSPALLETPNTFIPSTTGLKKAKAKSSPKALTPSTSLNQIKPSQDTPNSADNFATKSAQLSTLINQYKAARNILFENYNKFQNNSAIAQYNVREICLSLLATAEYAQQCGIYFEKIITDQTLTQPQIDTLQKSFDEFKAQCEKDCIAYKIPRQRMVFYPDQLNPPANVDDIVKILHLLKYVINGYAKMITSETGLYSTNVIIDYTGSGGTTIETGVIRVDINMFKDLIEFLYMFAHESGHLETMIYDQESTRTVPSPKLSYAIPNILSQQFANQENEAEADVNAAIVCALYDVSLSHSYSNFAAQPILSPAQANQDSHPQGIVRANIMQNSVSTLSYHFSNNRFGSNNIWQKFAEKVRSIAGINFREDIPTLAELLRIYNLSPNDKNKQIALLKSEYPNLFTNTTRNDYPPAPIVAVGIDRQLAALTNPNIPFQQIRRNTPSESIETFQEKWKLAGGKLPFPTSMPRAVTVASMGKFSQSTPTSSSDTPSRSPAPTQLTSIPLAQPVQGRPEAIKEQLWSNEQHKGKKTQPTNYAKHNKHNATYKTVTPGR